MSGIILKKTALIPIAAVAITASALVILYWSGFFAYASSWGPDDTPIKAIALDPAAFEGMNVTVIGAIGSRETPTLVRSSLTIEDSEGYYIDLLNPIPSWLKYEIEMPFIITGTFIHYECGYNETQAGFHEEGYGLVPISIEKVINFVH